MMFEKGCQDNFLSLFQNARILLINSKGDISLRAAGVVVEHNPFHNGHLHHIKKTKEITGADVVVAVMSGNFLQRGEPALVHKWARAEMALQSGVDLVIELPYAFATAAASDFAKGSVTLLDAIGCESFCFGSEDGTTQAFTTTLEAIQKNKHLYNATIHESMKTGISYPKSLQQAFFKVQEKTNESLVDLSKPNNILGFHYIQAAKQINSSMTPYTIPRIIAGYHEDIQQGVTIASATGIRKALFEDKNLHALSGYMPKTSMQKLMEWENEWKNFGSWETFWPIVQFIILRSSIEELRNMAEITEGMEYAFKKAAQHATSFQHFMEQVKSKRFTWTRIQRMLAHIFTNFTAQQQKSEISPSYIRILGMTEKGQSYLNENKKHFKLPIISKVGKVSNEMLLHDCHATTMYMAALSPNNISKWQQLDWKTPPIRLTSST